MNHPIRIVGSLLLVLAGATHAVDATAQALIQNGYVSDSYQCYKAKPSRGERFDERTVKLADQFETGLTEVTRPLALCNPADLDGAGIADPDTHLTSYGIKAAKVCSDTGDACSSGKDCGSDARCQAPKHEAQSNLLVENQFGRLLVDTSKADRLLVPGSLDEVVAPPPLQPDTYDVDHFKCYTVRVNKNLCEADPTLRCKTDADCPSGACNLGFPKGLEVDLQDPFTTPAQRLQVKKPTRLCNPVDKNDEGIQHPDDHLMCYQVKLLGDKHEKRQDVTIANQFGDLRLDTTKEDELCVPSRKTHTGPPPDGPTAPLNDTGIGFGGEYPQRQQRRLHQHHHRDRPAGLREWPRRRGRGRHPGQGRRRCRGLRPHQARRRRDAVGDQDGTWSDAGDETSGTQWSCVLDNVTGLWWEVKANDGGLRDKDWTYTSYDSAYDDGPDSGTYPPADVGPDNVWAGLVDTGSGVGSDNCGNLSEICTTEQYVADVNAAGLCGKTDWRMPTIDELITARHLGTNSPAIDTAYFSNTDSDGYWSASPYAANASYAWLLNFYDGYDLAFFRYIIAQVRLVRAGQ